MAAAVGAVWLAIRSRDTVPAGTDLNAIVDRAHAEQQKASKREFSSEAARQKQEKVLAKGAELDEQAKASRIGDYVYVGIIFIGIVGVYFLKKFVFRRS